MKLPLEPLGYVEDHPEWLWPGVKAFIEFGNKGVCADKNRDFELALECYKEAEVNLLHSIEHDATDDWCKNGLRKKLKKFQDRIKILELRGDENRRINKLRLMKYN